MNFNSKKRRTLFWLALALALGVYIVVLFNPRQNGARGVPDAKAAIARGETRFVSVYGMSVGVPGVAGGQHNGLVEQYGIKDPIGVGDFMRFPWDYRRQTAASEYAYSYNTHLLNYLLDNPDQKTADFLKSIEDEMLMLEKADPQADAKRSFASNAQFLLVYDNKELGYETDDFRTSRVDFRWLKMNPSVLRGEELARYDRLIKGYLVPYNRTLYRLLVQDWKRKGIETPADMDAMEAVNPVANALLVPISRAHFCPIIANLLSRKRFALFVIALEFHLQNLG